jgi:hypothetical protein
VNPEIEPTESIANDEKLMLSPAEGVVPITDEIDFVDVSAASPKLLNDKVSPELNVAMLFS